jgi:hypothetical protein
LRTALAGLRRDAPDGGEYVFTRANGSLADRPGPRFEQGVAPDGAGYAHLSPTHEAEAVKRITANCPTGFTTAGRSAIMAVRT